MPPTGTHRGGVAAIALRPLRHGERKPGSSTSARRPLRAQPRLRGSSARSRASPERDVDWLVDVGCCGREAVVAVDQATGRTVGCWRASSATPTPPEAEIAFEVVDEWQGRGVGKELLGELRALAREQGILRFRALIAHGNRPAFTLVHGVGEELRRAYEDGAVELVVRLA